MGEELKFQHQWAFRKRDNNSESSTEDSHSSSEPVFKKHKLVETKKVQRGFNKKDKSTFRGTKKGYEPVLALNDLKTFMGSLLDDLKGARENLCVWMKNEMHKLVEDGNVEAQKQKRSEPRAKAMRPVKSKKADAGLGSSYQNHQQHVHSNFGLIAQARDCNGHGDPENNKLDMSSYNYMQSRIDVDSARLNTMLDPSAYRQYFPSLQQQERFRNFAQNSMTAPIHQSLDSGFSVPNQVSLENHSRDMFTPGRYLSNNFNTHLNYRVDSGFSSFQAPSFRAPPK